MKTYVFIVVGVQHEYRNTKHEYCNTITQIPYYKVQVPQQYRISTAPKIAQVLQNNLEFTKALGQLKSFLKRTQYLLQRLEQGRRPTGRAAWLEKKE